MASNDIFSAYGLILLNKYWSRENSLQWLSRIHFEIYAASGILADMHYQRIQVTVVRINSNRFRLMISGSTTEGTFDQITEQLLFWQNRYQLPRELIFYITPDRLFYQPWEVRRPFALQFPFI